VFVSAQEETGKDITDMNETIKEKQRHIQEINQQIEGYKKKVAEKEALQATLAGELDLLDNRISKTKWEIEETSEQMSIINTELLVLNKQLLELTAKLEQDRLLLMSVLQQVQSHDENFPLKALFGSESLSELFDEIEALQTINSDLKSALDRTKQIKQSVEGKKIAEQTKQKQLEEKQVTLIGQKQELEEVIDAQQLLVLETKRSEAIFRSFVQELKQEQSVINQQVAKLQEEMEAKLNASDKIEGSSVITWPIETDKRKITALYHDQSYPFRHLFEHSGLDIAAPKGTSVHAAAPGYVAWARTGRLYGNYIMIIHTDGLATLYAHLSRMDVKVDQYVERGQVIGAVGSTGLSTGPHLHFEVREDGIPKNPTNYLK